MPSMKKSQRAGGSCGANNVDKPMVGAGSKSKKSKKSSKKASGAKSAPNVGYCMKCRTKVTMLNPTDMSKKTKIRTMKMRVGQCPKCKGKVYKIVGGG